jgi:hypothetical protein
LATKEIVSQNFSVSKTAALATPTAVPKVQRYSHRTVGTHRTALDDPATGWESIQPITRTENVFVADPVPKGIIRALLGDRPIATRS